MICKLKYFILIILFAILSGCVTNKPLKNILRDLEDNYFIFDKNENLLDWELIHYAAAIGTKEEIIEVIYNTKDINIQDNKKNTALIISQRYNNLETFEELLKAGAYFEWMDYFSKENIPHAIEIANKYGYKVDYIYNRKKYVTTDDLAELMPPNMDYIYFENAKAYPFESNNKDFSYVNCWWLAECSFLAYTHPGFARLVYEKAGFDNFKYFKQSQTECMVVWNNKSIIISFRGTSELNDVLADIRIIQKDFHLGGKVHRGFLDAYNSINDGDVGLKVFIEELVKENENRETWVTGHSLGGALAGICFTDLNNATGLYTFGSPRIGNKEFLKLTDGRSKWRIENNRDIITTIPKSNIDLMYLNMGNLIFYGIFGEFYDLTNTIYTEKNSNYKQSYIFNGIRGLRNHMPINYVVKSWNNLIDNELTKTRLIKDYNHNH